MTDIPMALPKDAPPSCIQRAIIPCVISHDGEYLKFEMVEKAVLTDMTQGQHVLYIPLEIHRRDGAVVGVRITKHLAENSHEFEKAFPEAVVDD